MNAATQWLLDSGVEEMQMDEGPRDPGCVKENMVKQAQKSLRHFATLEALLDRTAKGKNLRQET